MYRIKLWRWKILWNTIEFRSKMIFEEFTNINGARKLIRLRYIKSSVSGEVNFLVYGQDSKKKILSVGRPAKWKLYHLILRVGIFWKKKKILCTANKEEKPSQNNFAYQFIIYYNKDKSFLVLVIHNTVFGLIQYKKKKIAWVKIC